MKWNDKVILLHYLEELLISFIMFFYTYFCNINYLIDLIGYYYLKKSLKDWEFHLWPYIYN